MTLAAGEQDLQFRGRVAGSDISTANYDSQVQYTESTTVSSLRYSAETKMTIGQTNGTYASNAFVCDILAPKLARPTTLMGTSFYPKGNSGFMQFGGNFRLTTSLDSCTILTPASNLTGKAFLYGYNF